MTAPDRPLPVIGAALMTEDLPSFRDWILDKQRDVEVQSFFFPQVLTGDWTPLAEATRRHLQGHTGRLGIHGPFMGFDLDSHDPEVAAIAAKRLDQALDVCAAIGASQMVLHSPYTTWNFHNFENRPGAREEKIERCHRIMAAAVKRAGDQGVTLVIENIQDIDPDDRLILAQSFDSDAVRLSIDTGHAMYAHGRTGAGPVDYYVRRAGNWLDHVHLQDADGHADRHWAIGRGSVPWHAVFDALADLTSRPRLLLELKRSADIPVSMTWIEAQGLGQ